MKSVLISIVIPLAAFAGSIFVPNHHSDEVHLHAGFNLYQHGEKVDLSDLKYMKEQPCSSAGHDHDHELTPAEEQLEKAHLHDLVGDVAHVHRANATWGDLFANIGITFTEPVVGYTRDGVVMDILDQVIIPYERLILSEGTLDDPNTKLDSVPDEARIREVEQMSENCAS